jgi:hypothetical protein
MPRVSEISLRALLLALQRAGFGRLSEVHLGADPLEFLDHEPPASRRLKRDLQARAAKRRKERADPGSVRRSDPGALDLAGDRLDPLRGDLRPMLIQAHHDRHSPTPFPSHSAVSSTTTALTRTASSPTHRVPWDTVGTSYSNGRLGGLQPREPSTYAVRRGGPATFTAQVTRQPGHDIFRVAGPSSALSVAYAR